MKIQLEEIRNETNYHVKISSKEAGMLAKGEKLEGTISDEGLYNKEIKQNRDIVGKRFGLCFGNGRNYEKNNEGVNFKLESHILEWLKESPRSIRYDHKSASSINLEIALSNDDAIIPKKHAKNAKRFYFF